MYSIRIVNFLYMYIYTVYIYILYIYIWVKFSLHVIFGKEKLTNVIFGKPKSWKSTITLNVFFKQYVYSVCFSSKMVTLDVFYRIRSISNVLKFDTLLQMFFQYYFIHIECFKIRYITSCVYQYYFECFNLIMFTQYVIFYSLDYSVCLLLGQIRKNVFIYFFHTVE